MSLSSFRPDGSHAADPASQSLSHTCLDTRHNPAPSLGQERSIINAVPNNHGDLVMHFQNIPSLSKACAPDH